MLNPERRLNYLKQNANDEVCTLKLKPGQRRRLKRKRAQTHMHTAGVRCERCRPKPV